MNIYEKRSIVLVTIGTDYFLSIPTRCQLLYVHLVMNAEEDGTLSNAKAIARMVLDGNYHQDLEVLIDCGYLSEGPFEHSPGDYAIAYWPKEDG